MEIVDLEHNVEAAYVSDRKGIVLKLRYLIFILLFCIPILYISSGTKEERLEKLRREKAEAIREKLKIERKKRTVVKKEKGILKELQLLEVEQGKNEKRLAQLERQLVHWNRQIKKLQPRLKKMKEEFRKYKMLACDRIRTMYKLGYNGMRVNVLEFLFGASDLSKLLSRYKYINSISKADQKMLTNLQLQMRRIRNTENVLKNRIESIKKAKTKIKQEKISIRRNKQKRKELLEKYRTEKVAYDETLVELESAVAKFERLLGELEEGRMEVNKPENMNGISKKLVGKLPLPVQGEIISNMSSSESGITIKAKKGTKIRSVADGVVARVKRLIVGYGNTVLIDHGNGFISVYAHISEILVKKGQKVRKRQVIAKVGETGSLVGSVLYFELWRGVKRLNTKKWVEN